MSNIFEIRDENKTLLAKILSPKQITNSRVDLSSEKELLQCAIINANNNKKYDSHIHLKTKKITSGVQEAWYIVSGKVKFLCYNRDGVLVDTILLFEGDLCISYEGGHGYEILSDNTKVIEFKSGPYLGRDKDKILIKNLKR